MAHLVKRTTYQNLTVGDIARCKKAVRGSHGRKYKFLGAVFDEEDDSTPLYLDLVDIKSGNSRAVKPEFVVKDIAASKAAQARIVKERVAHEARLEGLAKAREVKASGVG